MKCPGCGYESMDFLETCKHCGAPMSASTMAALFPTSDPGAFVPGERFEHELRRRHPARSGNRQGRGGELAGKLDDEAMEVEEADLDGALAAWPAVVADRSDLPFRIDDDLFADPSAGAPETPVASSGSADPGGFWAAAGADLPGPAFVLPEEEPRAPVGVEPIIDRDEEVPERYWAPEIAGLGRRTLGLLVDQSLLLAVLGIFFLVALAALRFNGYESGLLLAADGLQAAALPFALLGAALSFAYSIYFHGSTGCTPGKALVGIEVRSADGEALSWGRAILRWLGAVLSLACAGIGCFWAFFEPRRRGWADLISGTVVARPQREPDFEDPRR